MLIRFPCFRSLLDQLVYLADVFLARLLSRILQRESRRFVAREQRDPAPFQSP